jgi:hypothetical protein
MEIRHSGVARNRHDLDCFHGLLTSLRFCRAKWTNPPCVHRLNGYDFAVFVRPMMASFKKIV